LTKDKTENKLIVYVGDGRSDFCPARVSDIVFAKDNLLRFMTKEELPCIAYKDLGDVHNYFQELLVHGRQIH
jgi:2-hydroxy-3-keto-5-methylthiopentenyl-1-phosphate phosphatase